jgi:hypothetical protein
MYSSPYIRPVSTPNMSAASGTSPSAAPSPPWGASFGRRSRQSTCALSLDVPNPMDTSTPPVHRSVDDAPVSSAQPLSR